MDTKLYYFPGAWIRKDYELIEFVNDLKLDPETFLNEDAVTVYEVAVLKGEYITVEAPTNFAIAAYGCLYRPYRIVSKRRFNDKDLAELFPLIGCEHCGRYTRDTTLVAVGDECEVLHAHLCRRCRRLEGFESITPT